MPILGGSAYYEDDVSIKPTIISSIDQQIQPQFPNVIYHHDDAVDHVDGEKNQVRVSTEVKSRKTEVGRRL